MGKKVKIRYSIIIPTLNRADYLEQCSKAISEQIRNKQGVEVIVVDDGSEGRIAHRNQDITRRNGFTYIYQENRGVASARNTGIDKSRGEWIIFLDDDVLPGDCWFDRITDSLFRLSESVVGAEGLVEGSGDGLWDREVQNLNGGAFLSCHLAVRRDILIELSGFDTTFEKMLPCCEDHELAARLLKKGKIVFLSDAKVIHLPRKVNLIKYILQAPKRIRCLLKADLYFYTRHPDQYRLFRHSETFRGTCLSVLFKNVYKTFRRRDFRRITANPLQSIALLIASLIEQLYAWIVVAELLLIYHKSMPGKKDNI
jgi:glycosyltransferase involved in cell wall biosynthesis